MLEKHLLIELKEYIKRHSLKLDCEINELIQSETKYLSDKIQAEDLEDFINETRKPTFSQVLFSFIDKKGAKDSVIYKKAGIDRRHFSKIRSNPDYRLGKNAAIALAIALELNEEETDRLLSSAGFSLSKSNKYDLVILFFIEQQLYDINIINEALDYYSLKPLTGVLE